MSYLYTSAIGTHGFTNNGELVHRDYGSLTLLESNDILIRSYKANYSVR